MGRYALLVGISTYLDGLKPLPSAVRDVDALREVLIDPEIGGFAESDVEALKDVDETAIRKAISRLFANRDSNDLLLFYFSGHGVTDSVNDFYLTGTSTDQNDLLSSAVPSDYIHKAMNQLGGSRRKVIILDCCHSGAFAKGMQAKDPGIVNVLPKLGGEGRAILTASDSRKYAFEQEDFELSLYTHFLVEGLKTGAADRDGDGHISAEELHEYVRDKVISANNLMSPKIYPVLEGYQIILAKAAQDDRLKFRKYTEEVIKRRKGKIFHSTRGLLNTARDKYKISESDAKEIEQELLLPYQIYDKRLEIYEQTLRNMVLEEFPLSEVTLEELEELAIGLTDEDLQLIENQIISPKQAEYEQQLQITQRQKKIERLKQQHLFTSGISAAEALKYQQPILASEIFGQQLQSKPSASPELTFEFVKLQVVKKRGFLGIGSETRIELEKKQGKVFYIREDVGNGISLDLVRIPAGKFTMGMPPAERQIALDNALKHGYDRKNIEAWLDFSTPQREVKVPEFWTGKYTVTNAQWFAVMGTKPAEKYDVKFQGEKQPVVAVSWEDCMEFCKKLSNKLGKNIRLPSEAEWEYACRANTTTPFYFGATITTDLVNYDGNYPYGDALKGEYRQKTVDVDSFSPNPWGLYQMHGNVWEWCSDRWHGNYKNAPQDGSSWETGTVGNLRVVRGGSWLNDALYCRSAYRSRGDAGGRYNYLGLRLVVF